MQMTLESWMVRGRRPGKICRKGVPEGTSCLEVLPGAKGWEEMEDVGDRGWAFLPHSKEVKVKAAQSCLILWEPMDFSARLLCPWGLSREEYWSG